MGQLHGQVAVITGGTTGIGYATAKRFIAEGAKVIITGQNPERVGKAAKELGARGVVADVTKLQDLEALAATVQGEFGGVDVLFANAGIAYFAPLGMADERLFDAQFDTNVKGVYFTVQTLLPQLKPGARIVVNASVVSQLGLPNAALYSGTKGALRTMVRSFAAELGPRGIRVNVVSPGFIPTEIMGKTGLPVEAQQGFEANVVATTPLQRVGTSDEVASAVLFLSSGESSYITGADLLVDGGLGNV